MNNKNLRTTILSTNKINPKRTAITMAAILTIVLVTGLSLPSITIEKALANPCSEITSGNGGAGGNSGNGGAGGAGGSGSGSGSGNGGIVGGSGNFGIGAQGGNGATSSPGGPGATGGDITCTFEGDIYIQFEPFG